MELVGTAECITYKRCVAETEIIRTKLICILNNALTQNLQMHNSVQFIFQIVPLSNVFI